MQNKKCPRCSRKWQTIYAEGVCKKCVEGMIFTEAWMHRRKRSIAAKLGWKTRRSRVSV